jgi:hypothetical protein
MIAIAIKAGTCNLVWTAAPEASTSELYGAVVVENISSARSRTKSLAMLATSGNATLRLQSIGVGGSRRRFTACVGGRGDRTADRQRSMNVSRAGWLAFRGRDYVFVGEDLCVLKSAL